MSFIFLSSLNSDTVFLFLFPILFRLVCIAKLHDGLCCEFYDGLCEGLGDIFQEADVLRGHPLQAVTGGVVADPHPGPEVGGVRHSHPGERVLTKNVLELKS